MKKIAIGIVIANTRRRVDPEEVISFIESQRSDLEIYELAPPQPGSIYGAAIDYMVVFSIASGAASIASLLWRAYDKLIAPKKTNDDSAGIIVTISKDSGSTERFWIGHEDKTKEVFIETFSEKVETIRQSRLPGESTERVIKELNMERKWIRRK